MVRTCLTQRLIAAGHAISVDCEPITSCTPEFDRYFLDRKGPVFRVSRYKWRCGAAAYAAISAAIAAASSVAAAIFGKVDCKLVLRVVVFCASESCKEIPTLHKRLLHDRRRN